ncbi:hypothetical protein C8R43DRAFT_963202 [Mycena crocata]|nr:hypothetical protein C8R43DRAFT_963202 [Mycena crocata]
MLVEGGWVGLDMIKYGTQQNVAVLPQSAKSRLWVSEEGWKLNVQQVSENETHLEVGTRRTENLRRVGLRLQRNLTHQRAWSLNVDAALASGGETFEKRASEPNQNAVTMPAYQERISAHGISKRGGIAYAAATRRLAGAARSHHLAAAATRRLEGGRKITSFGVICYFEVVAGCWPPAAKILRKWCQHNTKIQIRMGTHTTRGISRRCVIASAAAPRRLAGARDTPTFGWIRYTALKSDQYVGLRRQKKLKKCVQAGAKCKEMATYGQPTTSHDPRVLPPAPNVAFHARKVELCLEGRGHFEGKELSGFGDMHLGSRQKQTACQEFRLQWQSPESDGRKQLSRLQESPGNFGDDTVQVEIPL